MKKLPAFSPDDTPRKIKRLLAQPRACLLCGAFPPARSVLFVPDKPELWGGTRGKNRFMGYALCARCFTLPDVTRQVEARLQASLGPRRN